MKGYYYKNSDEDGMFLVPYLFIGKVCNNRLYVSMSPDKLEDLSLAIMNSREAVKENLALGKWAEFEIDGNGIEKICSFCFDKKEEEAGVIAADICKEMLSIFNSGG
jgi:hypothetical protein